MESSEDPFLKKKLLKETVKLSVEYHNNVRCALQDQDKYKRFLDSLVNYRDHKDANRVLNEALPLFSDHPDLFLQLRWFITYDLPQRPGVAISPPEETLLFRENNVFRIEESRYSVKSAKAAAERLVRENLERNPEEEIDVGQYFCSLNLKCIESFFGDDYFSGKLKMKRGEAVKDSGELGTRLEHKKLILEYELHEAEKMWNKAFKNVYFKT